MNAGFSNLDTLKQHLLAPALRPTTTYDVQLLDLGRGMAALFANFTQRRLAWMVGDTEIFPAAKAEFILSRFPITAVTLSELKLQESAGWVTQTDPNFILALDLANGIVNCGPSDVGPSYGQVRFTYNGGYFWETLEPDDAAFPSALPSGAAALPSDLYHAWLLQCKHVWQTIDPRGVKIVGEGDKNRVVPQQTFGDMDLIPQVAASLKQFIRYKLT